MAVSVLGELLVDGEPLSPRERVVLATLVIHSGRAVSPEEIADAYWGEAPPATWPKQVQAAVARLRRRLGPGGIVTGPGGYRLALDPEAVDAGRFERLARAGRLHLAESDPERALAALETALGLWRGRPYADLSTRPDALAEVGRLDELRALATEDLIQARLDRGEHGSLVGEAQALVRELPLRERRWMLLATALYRAGRQADALATLRAARRRFQDELGVDPGQDLADLESLILHQDPDLRPEPTRAPGADTCPYRGLAPYDAEDAEEFFGRESEVAAALDRLRRSRFLALAGPSGCGKSSLVRAGVVPALRREGRAVTVVTPGAGTGLRDAVASACDVIVVDQFEEIFHRDLPADEIAELCHALAEHPATVVLTVRSDFLDLCAAQPSLGPLLVDGIRLVTPMSRDQLRAAIVEPARRAGLRLEHGLVELVLRDATGSPGVLPHVSHALVETWLRREGPVLTVDGYEASGGISGAIAQSADLLYQSLDPRQRDLCRSTLLRLITLSPDGSPVRQRMQLRPLREDTARDRVLASLTAARLLSTEGDSVMVAHEAVASAWPRLRGWLEESADDVRRTAALTAAAERWAADGEPDEDLYRGARLEAALELRHSGAVELTPTEVRFLEESARHEEQRVADLEASARHEIRQNRRLRGYLTASVALLVLILIASGLLVAANRETRRQQEAANIAKESATVEALTARSLALRATERDVAALLAAEAYRRWPDDPRSRSALLGTLTSAEGFLGSRYLPLDRPLPGVQLPGSQRLLLTDGSRALLLDGAAVVDEVRLPWSAAEAVPGAYGAAVSSDGDTGVVARGVTAGDDVDTELVTLDLPSLRTHRHVVVHRIGPGSVSVSPDGSFVALGGNRDPAIAVLDTSTGAVRTRSFTPDGEASDWAPLTLVTWTGSGDLAVGGGYSRIRVVDPVSLTTTTAVRLPAGAANIALTATEDQLVSSGSRLLARIDLGSARVRWTHGFAADHPAPCPWLAASARAGAVFCGNWFGGLERRDLTDGSVVAALDPQLGSVGPLAVSADGRELTALGAAVPAVSRWRLDGSGPAHRLVARGQVVYDGFDPGSDDIILTARRPRGAREFDDLTRFAAWDASADRATFHVPGRASGLGWAGSDVLVGWSNREEGVAFLSMATRRWYRNEPSLDFHDHAWITNDGSTMWSADADGVVHVVDAATGRLTDRRIDVGGRVGSFSVSPDGSRVAAASLDDEGWQVKVFDATTGDVVAEGLRGPQVAAYAPDGDLYAATDGRLTRHDPDDLSETGTLGGAQGQVNSLQFSADGTLLLVTANDESAAIYDVATGLRLGDPVETAAPLIVPAFLRPDGRAVAVTVSEGVALWDLAPEHQFAATCRIAGRELTAEEWSTYFGPDVRQVATCASVLGEDS